MAFPVPHIIYLAGGERIVPIRRNLGFGVGGGGGSDDYDSVQSVGRFGGRREAKVLAIWRLLLLKRVTARGREGHWKLCQNALGQTDLQRDK